MDAILSRYIGVSPGKVARLLTLSQQQVYADQEYLGWVNQLDAERLYDTLQYARSVYEAYMPEFSQHLSNQFGMHKTVMSAYTLGNWLVGFLQFPNTINGLTRMHQHIPRQAIADLLPRMLEVLQEMPEGGREWQRALAILSLPLLSE